MNNGGPPGGMPPPGGGMQGGQQGFPQAGNTFQGNGAAAEALNEFLNPFKALFGGRGRGRGGGRGGFERGGGPNDWRSSPMQNENDWRSSPYQDDGRSSGAGQSARDRWQGQAQPIAPGMAESMVQSRRAGGYGGRLGTPPPSPSYGRPPAAPPAWAPPPTNAALRRLAEKDPWELQQAAERRRWEKMERDNKKSSWSARAGAGPENPNPGNNAALQRLADKAYYPPDQQAEYQKSERRRQREEKAWRRNSNSLSPKIYPQQQGPIRALQRLSDKAFSGQRGGDMALEERRYRRMNKKTNSLSQWDSNTPYPQNMGPNRALQRLSENAFNGQRGGDMALEERRYRRANRKTNSLSQWDDNTPYPQNVGPNRALQRLEERARSGYQQPRWERSDNGYDDSYDGMQLGGMQGGMQGGGMLQQPGMQGGGMQQQPGMQGGGMQQQPGMQPGMSQPDMMQPGMMQPGMVQPGMLQMTVVVPPGLFGGMPMQVQAPTGPMQVLRPVDSAG